MQQVVSRARGIICGETKRWPQFVRASRGASRAGAQACALVTPARLARGVGGVGQSHQETTGAAGGIGHLVRRPREQSAMSGHLVGRRRQLPAVSGHLVRRRWEQSAHRTLRSRCSSSWCARGHQAPRGPQRCGKSIASLTKASATTFYKSQISNIQLAIINCQHKKSLN